MAKFKVGDKVRVNSPGYRANGAEGSIMMVYLSGNPQKYLVDFGGGAHSEMTETSLVAANSRALNDKWIDDFHVIVTSGKPDASLLSALKEKATAWKLSKKNFSDRTAADRHNAAESKVYDIARRLGAKVIQQGAVMKVVMPNSSVCNSTNAARSPLYTGKAREVIDKITQGKYIGGAVGTVYYNPNGPFKWMINSSGWVYVAQPSRLNVLGDHRFGWKVFRVEKDGMLKQTNYHDFDSIQEAQKAFDELKSINSTNPVVIKALNAVVTNANFKVGDKVQVFAQGDWTTGKVVKVKGNRYDVQLDDRFGTKMLDVTDGKWGSIKPMNAVARNSTEDLHILLATADTDIDDGDIDEAKQIIRDTRTRAIRSGYTREWMAVAKRVGMK